MLEVRVQSLETENKRLKESVTFLEDQLNQVLSRCNALEERIPTLDDPKAEAYVEWSKKTRNTVQDWMDEILRSQQLGGVSNTILIALARVILEKGEVTMEEIMEWLPITMRNGIHVLGIDPQKIIGLNQEDDAQERYAREGLKEWSGVSKSPG